MTHPFDAAAPIYDAAFTHTRLGRTLRRAVWQQLATAFRPGDHVLELGCGTGEDAVWLAQRGVRVTATDASPAMLEVARRKAVAAGVAAHMAFARLDIGDSAHWGLGPHTAGAGSPDADAPQPAYDGAFSSFGPLNCVPDRTPVAAALARWLRPAARVVLVVMGPFCPWEMAWHLAHGEVRAALRRLRAGASARIGSGAIPVWYPSPRRLQHEFAPYFRRLATAGIGALLPPTQLSHLVERRPRLLAALAGLDHRLAGAFPWTWLNDHYLMAFEKR